MRAVAMLLLVAACGEATQPRRPTLTGLVAVTPATAAGTVGTGLSPAPTVRVLDQYGAPLSGVAVVFTVTAGGGTVVPASVVTDATGTATTTWTLGGVATTNTIAARAGSLAPVIFSASAAHGPASSIVPVLGDGQAFPPLATLSHPLIGRVVDRFGNPIAGAVVTFTVMAGGGAIQGTSAVADASGVVTSGRWTLGPETGLQKVRAQAGDIDFVFTADSFGCPTSAFDVSCATGGQLLFTRPSDGQIYRVHMDGSGATRLGAGTQAQWSPDGQRIAFVRQVNGIGDIYLMDADGSNVVRRTRGANYWDIAWSPDGRRLAVTSYGLNVADMWIITTDDDGSRPIHLATQATSPSWSPDGRKISFVRASADYESNELYTINADGTGMRQMTADPAAWTRPTWSPDGQRIASVSCDDGGCGLHVMNADGSGQRQIAGIANAGDAAWSPGGEWIAMTLHRSSGRTYTPLIAYVPADGGTVRTVAGDGYGPSWRP